MHLFLFPSQHWLLRLLLVCLLWPASLEPPSPPLTPSITKDLPFSVFIANLPLLQSRGIPYSNCVFNYGSFRIYQFQRMYFLFYDFQLYIHLCLHYITKWHHILVAHVHLLFHVGLKTRLLIKTLRKSCLKLDRQLMTAERRIKLSPRDGPLHWSSNARCSTLKP